MFLDFVYPWKVLWQENWEKEHLYGLLRCKVVYLFFHPKNGGDMFIRKIRLSPNSMKLQHRRLYSSWLTPWEPQTLEELHCSNIIFRKLLFKDTSHNNIFLRKKKLSKWKQKFVFTHLMYRRYGNCWCFYVIYGVLNILSERTVL